MWRLQVASTSDNDPLLNTLNNFAGRLTWEYNSKVDDADQLDHVEQAREQFTKNRLQQQHSSDILYRNQFGGAQNIKRRKLASVCPTALY